MSTSRVTWGHGEEHYRPGDPYRQPPHMFRGRAGVVVEVAPNRFVSWRMRETFGAVETEQDFEEIHSAMHIYPVYRAPTLAVVRFELEGYLDAAEEQAPRPDWATETAGEIEARRALEGR